LAFTGNFMCSSFKRELLEAKHNFLLSGGDTFKIAMYTNTAAFTAATTAYTATNEVTGTNYVAGGGTLTRINPALSGTTAYADFADYTWSTATISAARGALLYNVTASNATVVVLDFGSDKSSSAGDFTIQFPTADASNAIIRIA
jgi:hypothetical protein